MGADQRLVHSLQYPHALARIWMRAAPAPPAARRADARGCGLVWRIPYLVDRIEALRQALSLLPSAPLPVYPAAGFVQLACGRRTMQSLI